MNLVEYKEFKNHNLASFSYFYNLTWYNIIYKQMC